MKIQLALLIAAMVVVAAFAGGESLASTEANVAAKVEIDDFSWRGGPSKEWFVNWDRALADARKRGTTLFILQTGSDWCGACKYFKTNVLDRAEFIDFARKNLTLVYIDIPIDNPLCEEQKFHNWLVEKCIPFGKGVPDVVLMNTNGEKLGRSWHGRKRVEEYIDLLRQTIVTKGEPVKTAERLFKDGYARLASEVMAERSKLPPVSTADFKVAISGVAVVKSGYGMRLIKDAVFHPVNTPQTIPFGSEAVFRMSYQFPKGYEGITWITPHKTTYYEFHNEYFRDSRCSDEWMKGSGTAYAKISFTEKGKTSTLSEVSIHVNSDPRLSDLQFGWVLKKVPVRLTFMGKDGVPEAEWQRHALELARMRKKERAQKNGTQRYVEPLLPFAQAVRKAKDGDGAGLYAVAIHYASGFEIVADSALAMKYLQKASDAGYANAVLLKALIMEDKLKELPVTTSEKGSPIGRRLNPFPNADGVSARTFYERTGSRYCSFKPPHRESWYYMTNEIAIAEIRDTYMNAMKLGSPFAEIELARFDRRMARIRKEANERLETENAWRVKVEANARLAQELLGEPPAKNPEFDYYRVSLNLSKNKDSPFPSNHTQSEPKKLRERTKRQGSQATEK